MSDIKNLAQAGSSMFERNIAIKASKEQEVQIATPLEYYVGFICGLDENWLQLCGKSEDQYDKSKDWELVLLNRSTLISVHPTGATSNDLDESIREYVQIKIHNFSVVSKSFLEKKR